MQASPRWDCICSLNILHHKFLCPFATQKLEDFHAPSCLRLTKLPSQVYSLPSFSSESSSCLRSASRDPGLAVSRRVFKSSVSIPSPIMGNPYPTESPSVAQTSQKKGHDWTKTGLISEPMSHAGDLFGVGSQFITSQQAGQEAVYQNKSANLAPQTPSIMEADLAKVTIRLSTRLPAYPINQTEAIIRGSSSDPAQSTVSSGR
jgi:hypothetical protein